MLFKQFHFLLVLLFVHELIYAQADTIQALKKDSVLPAGKRVFKLHPFSPLFGKVTIGYEQVLKRGINLELKAGDINSNFNIRAVPGSNKQNEPVGYGAYGGYVQGGIKFLLGQDSLKKGLISGQPLAGSYIRVDAIIVDISYRNANVTLVPNKGLFKQSTNANTLSAGMFASIGKQWVFGNRLTLDYYIGLGISGASSNYQNQSLVNNNLNNIITTIENKVSNYYGFIKIPAAYVSITYGLSVGYIFEYFPK